MSELIRYGQFIWAVASIVLLLVAWRAARCGNIPRHRALMLLLTLLAWLFVLLYLLRYRYPALSPQVPAEYIPWIAFHGTLALLPLFGATLLVWGRLRRGSSGHLNRHHRCYGRLLIPLWLFTHLGGVVNLLLFY